MKKLTNIQPWIRATWCLSPNFGDALTPWLIHRLTGQFPLPASQKQSHGTFIVTGSILNWANPGCTVWGAGLANRSDCINPEAKLLAVRGPIALERAASCGCKVDRTAIGDPALVLPLLYTPPKLKKRWALGIIPHYIEQELAVPWLSNVQGIKTIDILAPVTQVINEITSCRTILSSSLHGLIAAHTYKIPAQWIKLSTRLEGDGTKFLDYLTSVKLQQAPWELDLASGIDLDKVVAAIPKQVPDIAGIQKQLMACCPFGTAGKSSKG